MTPTATTIGELLERYRGVLLDVFGVLLDASGALPGARELLVELERRGTPYAIVTNDASRSTATYAQKFAGIGLSASVERFVTSGSLLPGFLRSRNLAGARICVLGTADSVAYAVAGGAVPVGLAEGIEIDVLAVCDDDGFDFLPSIEHALSAVVRAIDAGRRPTLVLPNPDLVYPKGKGELGFTAGAIALLIEAALARRFPGGGITFEQLGKPQPHLFTAAADKLGLPASSLVMIGDQLETDIAGARAARIDSALLAGVSRWTPVSPVTPTWLLGTIAP
ncbi:MAG: Haloacid dehalogenase domain protein hydrolase [Myxococcales bacterium]|nr:Haloacid dehalogenase domain protein hydrolase [Myxococcales bacterium]